jgi:hypothetical protein
MNFLVDANVLSEATRSSPNPRVIDWLETHLRALVVDPIILGEVHLGILVLPPGRKRTTLETWFDRVCTTMECLPWDQAVGLRWGKLVSDLRRKGQPLPVLDGMIAATALTYGLAVATRNVRDFRRAGVEVVNPFD